MQFTYLFEDPAGEVLVQSFDSATRTFTFHYDLDLDLSGGPGVEYVDYVIGITGEAGSINPSITIGFQTLRVKNPCFDPSLVSIVTEPLPAGPHSYTLYEYQPDDPYWIMTHEAWHYTT